jgi:hypothetical protein
MEAKDNLPPSEVAVNAFSVTSDSQPRGRKPCDFAFSLDPSIIPQQILERATKTYGSLIPNYLAQAFHQAEPHAARPLKVSVACHTAFLTSR